MFGGKSANFALVIGHQKPDCAVVQLVVVNHSCPASLAPSAGTPPDFSQSATAGNDVSGKRIERYPVDEPIQLVSRPDILSIFLKYSRLCDCQIHESSIPQRGTYVVLVVQDRASSNRRQAGARFLVGLSIQTAAQNPTTCFIVLT